MEFSSELFDFVFNQSSSPIFILELTKKGDVILIKGNLAFSNFFQLGSKLRLNIPFFELEFPFLTTDKEAFLLHIKSVARYEIPASQDAFTLNGHLPYRIQISYGGEEEIGQKKRVVVLIQEQKVPITLRTLSRNEPSLPLAISQFGNLFDVIENEGLVVVNSAGSILFVNRYIETNFKVLRESVLGIDVSALIVPPKDTSFYVSKLFELNNSASDHKFRVVFTLNGVYKHVRLRVTKYVSKGEDVLLIWITPDYDEEAQKKDNALQRTLSTALTALPVLVFQISELGLVENLTQFNESSRIDKYSNLRNKLLGCLSLVSSKGCGDSFSCDLCSLRVGIKRCFEDKRDVTLSSVSLHLTNNGFESQVVKLKVCFLYARELEDQAKVIVVVEVEPKVQDQSLMAMNKPIELLKSIAGKVSTITLTKEGIIASVDASFLSLTGYNVSELLGKSFYKLILGYKKSLFHDISKKSPLNWFIMKEEENEGNLEIFNRNGSSHIVTYILSFRKIDNEQTVGVLAITYNTPSIEEGVDLHSSLNKFKIALDSHHIGMWEIAWPSQVVTVSDKWRNITGVIEPKLTFKNFVNDFVVFEQRERVMGNFKQFVDGIKGQYHDEFQIQHQTKGIVWLRSSATVIQRNAVGNPTDIVGFIEDVTTRKATEDDLLRKESNFRNLTENIPGVAFRCLDDHRWTSLFFSEAIVELTGYSAHEYVIFDRHFSQDILPEFLPLNRSNTKESKGREIYEVEYKIKDRNGRIKWINERGRFIYNKRGKLIYLDGFLQDVTVQREREETINRVNQHLELIINSANVGLWEQNISAKLIEFNSVFFKSLGYVNHPNVIANNEFFQLIHPEDIALVQERHQEYLHGVIDYYQIELRLRCYDGSYKWFLSTGKLVLDETPKGASKLVGVIQDIDSYKQAQINMALIQSRILSFIESTDSLVWMVDNEFKIVYANQRFLEIMHNLYGLELHVGDNLTDEVLIFNADFWRSVFLEVISSVGNKTFTSELYYLGKLVTMEYTMYTTMHNNEAIGITCMAHDITYLKESEDKMIQEASENRVMSNFGAFLATKIEDLATVSTYIVKNITEILSSEFSCVIYADSKSGKFKLVTNNEIVLNCSAKSVAEGLLEGFGIQNGFVELTAIKKPTYKDVQLELIANDKSRFVIETLGLLNVFVCPVNLEDDTSIAWLIFATSNNAFSVSEMEVIKHVAELFSAVGERLSNKQLLINSMSDLEDHVQQKCKITGAIAAELNSKLVEVSQISDILKGYVIEGRALESLTLLKEKSGQMLKLAKKLAELTK